MKFEPAQIIRKSSQVGGQTRHKSTQVKACDELRSRFIRTLGFKGREEVDESQVCQVLMTTDHYVIHSFRSSKRRKLHLKSAVKILTLQKRKL